uniref:Uncharacterized protein n=1 Tax=Bradyrhizobium diazoefficiens TaxID=1355477 RepID=A0A810BMN6_9BRAD|nr:hypothetical protein XF8B_69240 [Bradyrhizobium diazoefficiens]BCF46589.1 hypothetical protein XF16B_70790 [Bradyrhizobium diazoefficiens]
MRRGVRRQRAEPLTNSAPVIPGRAQHEPGIYRAAELVEEWIPGSRCARPGMTAVGQAAISFNTAINAAGAVTFGA